MRKGFTLIELIVALAIITFLSFVVLASLKASREQEQIKKCLDRQFKYTPECTK